MHILVPQGGHRGRLYYTAVLLASAYGCRRSAGWCSWGIGGSVSPAAAGDSPNDVLVSPSTAGGSGLGMTRHGPCLPCTSGPTGTRLHNRA